MAKLVNFDIEKCRWVIWGAKDDRDTFSHIHEAFLRALRYLEKDVVWLDANDDILTIDFSNSLFLGMNCSLQGLPQRKDCFYVIHNILGDPWLPYFDGLKLLAYGLHVSTNTYSSEVMELAPQAFFEPSARSLQFRWGTDLLPHEIEANKPTRAFNSDSRVFNYIGTVDGEKNAQLQNFIRACRENGIEYRQYGGSGGFKIVSAEEHVQLVKVSYLAPAIQGMDQVNQGYVSCRLFKNISYGQMGLTYSKYAQELFEGGLIYNPDAYQLFYDAKERLQTMPVKELHDLMDIVARDHTYLNKISAIEQAVRFYA